MILKKTKTPKLHLKLYKDVCDVNMSFRPGGCKLFLKCKKVPGTHKTSI